MTTDKELRETYTLEFNDLGILVVTFLKTLEDKDENTHRAEFVRDDIFKFIEKEPSRGFKLLVDIRPMEESKMSLGAAKVYREVAMRQEIRKIAIIGDAHKRPRILELTLSIMSSLRNKVLWFSVEEQATMWLSS